MILAMTLAATMAIQKPQVEVGKHIPDVALVDMAGNSVRLSSFRGKKLILFNWASW
jgi:peroxiredoxin